MMYKLIINADDCGRTSIVNQEIKRYIEEGVLTSTSVMANMDDFDGGVTLYEKYSERVSFGAHLNLTQGTPLTDPSTFLKYGFCKAINGKVEFDGMSFRWKYINAELRNASYKELMAQIEKIRGAGVHISHIDSHQHIHFAPCLTPVFAQVAKDTGILKMRRPKNFLHMNVHDIAIRGLNAYYMFCLRGFKTTDYFSSADSYIEWPKKQDATCELMCHPGHENLKYQEEMKHIVKYLSQNVNEVLITYNELK